jgi:hypothetical protein
MDCLKATLTMRKLLNTVLILCSLCSSLTYAHGDWDSISTFRIPERKIQFPNTEDFLIIVADLHTHSVFSDGHVWPNIRVEEALRDGLDLIAVTEHLEYQPHQIDIPHPDRNRSFHVAKKSASNKNLMVINGSEITRDLPTGHINAIFINDANKLMRMDRSKIVEAEKRVMESSVTISDDEEKQVFVNYALTNMLPIEEVLKKARDQDAFVFLNHPMRGSSEEPDKIARLTELQQNIINHGYVHGIEIVNGDWFSEEAFQIAIENQLTLIGTSDIHELIDWNYQPHLGGHRPVTLILSKDRTENSIKESLFQGRTVVWYKDYLFGLEENLEPLIKSSLKIIPHSYKEDTKVIGIEIENASSAGFLIENSSDFTFHNLGNLFYIEASSKKYIEIKTIEKLENINFSFKVLNAFFSPNETIEIDYNFSPEKN